MIDSILYVYCVFLFYISHSKLLQGFICAVARIKKSMIEGSQNEFRKGQKVKFY